MTRGGGMVDVHLDDGSVPGGPGGRNGPNGPNGPNGDVGRGGAEEPGPRGRRRPLHRRPGVWAVVAVVVLGLVAQGWTTWVQREDARRVAAAAEVPGTAPSLRTAPSVRWADFGGGTQVLAGLVLSAVETRAGMRAEARDAATGAVRWDRALPLDGEGRWPRCDVATADDALLLCVLDGGGQTAPNTDATLGGQSDRLLVVDAADGALLRQDAVPDARIGLAAVGPDDVVLAALEDDAVVLRRSDARTGATVWEARLDVSVPPYVTSADLWLQVTSGLAMVSGVVAGVVDVEDGQVVGSWASAVGALPVQLLATPSGLGVWRAPGRGVWVPRTGDAAGAGGTGAADEAGTVLPGEPGYVPVDDGSEPDVVLVRTVPGVAAVDTATGAELWRRPAAERVLLRLGGRAVLAEDRTLRVVRTRSGELLWTARLDDGVVAPYPPVTDGVRVLVPGVGDAGRPEVVAHDLADGDVVWTLALPEGVRSISVQDRVLVSGLRDRLLVWR